MIKRGVSIHDTDRLRPLPIRPRPKSGETIESYVRRLARANHLRPSYLHGYICGPGRSTRALRPERLAALAGRPLSALQHALVDLTPPPRHEIGARADQPRPPSRQVRRQADKPELFAAIRRDARDEGLTIHTLATRYRIHRRTVRQALASPTPPPRKQRIPRTPALKGLGGFVEAMLNFDRNLTAWRVWERLLDEHDAEVSYSTVRDYLTRHRSGQIR